jgi:hypothetical protein
MLLLVLHLLFSDYGYDDNDDAANYYDNYYDDDDDGCGCGCLILILILILFII